jgi:hypothetical protein
MSMLAFKRRDAGLSRAGQVARRSRTQACTTGFGALQRGGVSSVLRLTPLGSESTQGSGWASLVLSRLTRAPKPAPAFLCTDFAPSQWLTEEQ